MEINTKKTKLIVNSANNIRRKFKVKGQKLGSITSYCRPVRGDTSEDVTNEKVCSKMQAAVGEYDELLTMFENRTAR